MKNGNPPLSTLYSLLYAIFMVVIAILLTSCISEEISYKPAPKPDDPVKSGYMKIRLNTPESHIPRTKSSGTRSMDNQAERFLDTEMLNVLVFSYNDDGNGNITETFYYKATISGSVEFDENDGSKATVVVRLLKSASPNDLFRFVIVANHDFSGIEMVRNITTKQEVLEQLTYSVSGKWNADSQEYSLFPMWGEGVPVAVTDNMPSPAIDLHRALARIDVGLNFVTENGKLTEQAYGIPGFKLAEVLVFRTFDKGYIAPLDGAASEIPGIPPVASRHDDNSPLDYIIPDIGGVDSYIREIYVPEAGLPPTPDNDNIHCIVVGGYYQNSSVVSYYRLDFAKETGPGTRTYLPILRNHRYVFNITQVNGPGFSSAISALQSTPTIGNVVYDLVAWDATIHEMETQGQYYFGIDNRDLLAEPQSTVSDTNNKFTVKYQTNYPLSSTDPIKFAWASVINDPFSSPIFDAQWLPDGKNILITVINDNLTNTFLSDTLYVYAGPFVKKIVVRQKYYEVKYAIDCASVSVKGTYKQGITLNPSVHYISLSLVAENRSIQGHSYVIETSDPNNNGISFRAEGIFDFTGIQQGSPLRININMKGSGILQAPVDEHTFSLPIVSDSPFGSSCEAKIHFIIPAMNILVLSNPYSIDGYAISEKNGGAGKLINSLNNFGSNDNSVVKVEGFNYITSTTYDFKYAPTSTSFKWVTGTGNNGKIADIVYITFPAFFENPTADLLVEYLEKGGVIVAFLENASAQYLAGNIFKGSTINSNKTGQGGSIYPFPAHSSSGLSGSALQNVLKSFENDPILNGPFGDVRDKQWGQDDIDAVCLVNLPISNPNLTIYSYNKDIAPVTPVGNSVNATSFKYESPQYNIVWFGDGGFMASDEGKLSPSAYTDLPLYWDINTFFPTYKPVYGRVSNNRMSVYNSIVFCNIWAWAVTKSESLREKRNNALSAN